MFNNNIKHNIWRRFGISKMYLKIVSEYDKPHLPVAKAVVQLLVGLLLLLTCCLVVHVFPLVVGVLCLSLFCCALLCVLFSFAIALKRKREAGCLAFIVIRVSCYCEYSVVCPYGVVRWSKLAYFFLELQ